MELHIASVMRSCFEYWRLILFLCIYNMHVLSVWRIEWAMYQAVRGTITYSIRCWQGYRRTEKVGTNIYFNTTLQGKIDVVSSFWEFYVALTLFQSFLDLEAGSRYPICEIVVARPRLKTRTPRPCSTNNLQGHLRFSQGYWGFDGDILLLK